MVLLDSFFFFLVFYGFSFFFERLVMQIFCSLAPYYLAPFGVRNRFYFFGASRKGQCSIQDFISKVFKGEQFSKSVLVFSTLGFAWVWGDFFPMGSLVSLVFFSRVFVEFLDGWAQKSGEKSVPNNQRFYIRVF